MATPTPSRPASAARAQVHAGRGGTRQPQESTEGEVHHGDREARREFGDNQHRVSGGRSPLHRPDTDEAGTPAAHLVLD